MRVLVIGSSSKEHALIWKLLQSEKYKDLEILAVPGNKAIELMGEEQGQERYVRCLNIDTFNAVSYVDRLLEIAIVRNMDLTIVGDSKLFQFAIVDKFRSAGKLICGPTKEAAKLEWSHYFAKELMLKYDVPTSKYAAFDKFDLALAYLQTVRFPVLVKPDNPFLWANSPSLAKNYDEAEILLEKIFRKDPGINRKVVIEEWLNTQEFTISTICDGTLALSLTPTQSYKSDVSVGEDDNYLTDMGAYAPALAISEEVMYCIRHQIINPIMQATRELGSAYTGILTFDVALCPPEVKLLQIRTDFNSSEAQVMLPLLDEDLFDVLKASARENLIYYKDGFHRYLDSAISIGLFSYPQTDLSASEKFEANLDLSKLIDFVDAVKNPTKALIFPDDAEQKQVDQKIASATAVSESLLDAQIMGYKLVDSIALPGKYYRKDIGDQGML